MLLHYIGILIGEAPLNIPITDAPEKAFAEANVIIDFSRPVSLEKNLGIALTQQKPYLICFTGINDVQKELLEKASQTIPLILAPNTSLGIALLKKLSVVAGQILGPSYDVSILEMHHHHKIDSPSGTALSLAKALTHIDHLKKNTPPYPSLTPRPLGHIECVALKGGSIVGDHTVIFAGEKDIIKLEHRALDRSLYAQGALKAALWLFGKSPGFYTMDDVLGVSL